jgi:uncharacterized protein with NRDE domain
VRRGFETWLASASQSSAAELFTILGDRAQAGIDEELPSTGLSAEWERTLSAPFICHPDYGTRCSTVLLLEQSGALYLAERRFDPRGELLGETEWSLGPGEWL